ncbi:aminotransferase-like domain-containing protein [Catenuloplanes indicus]|uniref:DNA-binding transcriptional MocR family regulator n=1 Tax=Catenuloplanes indicus TaxID=137267 RepID=A0AAE4AY05_9ACTN|nr:PLP-dependent aminotransferase family protein [Catenuloplanes indicus]MDQ0367620.1 DNA-binding transcriptional MocR family regulator [Catenuloplanes indicus]
MALVQFHTAPGTLDLGWGHPHPDALPVGEWAEATAAALRRYGAAALTYGYAAGPGPLIEWIKSRAGGEVFVTAGASHALELVASVFGRGGGVLVDTPTYHLALATLADHGLDLVAAPADADGIDPAAMLELIERRRAAGRPVTLLYLVPTYGNPTGRSLPAARRAELIEVARRGGVTIVEDDTYRELSYDGVPAPAPLFSADSADTVIRIGSFAKTVAPGLRLGWITASADRVAALVRRGYVDSGGGVNHTAALAMAEFAGSGAFDAHLERIRRRYAGQRDALVDALRRYVPQAAFDVPAGGWFLWVRLLSADQLVEPAARHGVGFLPGNTFFLHPAPGRPIRLAFSHYGEADLTEAARRLATAAASLSPK